jgi:hypothetical protein
MTSRISILRLGRVAHLVRYADALRSVYAAQLGFCVATTGGRLLTFTSTPPSIT